MVDNLHFNKLESDGDTMGWGQVTVQFNIRLWVDWHRELFSQSKLLTLVI